jgi:hypothetical protein
MTLVAAFTRGECGHRGSNPAGREHVCHQVRPVHMDRHLQWMFHEGFYDINYFTTSDLIIICHCIYEERDEISFMGMKFLQLISNVMKIM